SKSASALVTRTFINQTFLQLEPHADRDRLVREMEHFSLRAIAADRSDPRAWSARSVALAHQYRWNEALEALDEALRIDPNRTSVYRDRAIIMVWMGRPENAFAELDKAAGLDTR